MHACTYSMCKCTETQEYTDLDPLVIMYVLYIPSCGLVWNECSLKIKAILLVVLVL